jgi:hypothetical protein
MFMHPAIATAIADQHRRDLITRAGAGRLARSARDRRSRLPRTARRAITTGAAAAAAAVLRLTPAGATTARDDQALYR